MQSVWEAKDFLLPHERRVALKTPLVNPPVRREESASDTFRDSATKSARINHPNVAATLDYFREDGAEFYVEEFFDGANLREAIFAPMGRPDPYLSAQLFRRLVRGVHAAHERNVVHRDLKPENVLVDFLQGPVKLKVTDFGVAVLAGQALKAGRAARGKNDFGQKTFETAAPYMAPEMLEDSDAASFASDVWSLGALGYHLLQGKPPFGAGNVEKVRDAIRRHEALPSQFDDCHPQFADVANALYQLCRHCLQNDVKLRPTTEDLQRACEDICYAVLDRRLGTVYDKLEIKKVWLIRPRGSLEETAMFHGNSVFGREVVVGDTVMFALTPGHPWSRAFPVVKYGFDKALTLRKPGSEKLRDPSDLLKSDLFDAEMLRDGKATLEDVNTMASYDEEFEYEDASDEDGYTDQYAAEGRTGEPGDEGYTGYGDHANDDYDPFSYRAVDGVYADDE